MEPLTADEVFDGWSVIGCCVLSHDYLTVLLQQTESNPEFNRERPCIKFAQHNLSVPLEDRWSTKEFESGWKRPKVVHTKLDEFLVADRQGMVYYMGLRKDKDFEDPIGEDWGGVKNLKNINGTIYGAYVARTLYKRLGRGKWQKFNDARNFPGYDKIVLGGFEDVDGFSENDIYCVGSNQDVWHFDSKNWKPLDICDGRFEATCVCCAEDGYVYIGFEDGRIAKGRDDVWHVTPKDDRLRKIDNIVYYRGRVFVGINQGTYLLNEDLTFTPFDFDGQLPFRGGPYIYTAYDKLLVANGKNQVAFYDGEKWLDIHKCDFDKWWKNKKKSQA